MLIDRERYDEACSEVLILQQPCVCHAVAYRPCTKISWQKRCVFHTWPHTLPCCVCLSVSSRRIPTYFFVIFLSFLTLCANSQATGTGWGCCQHLCTGELVLQQLDQAAGATATAQISLKHLESRPKPARPCAAVGTAAVAASVQMLMHSPLPWLCYGVLLAAPGFSFLPLCCLRVLSCG